MITRTLYYSQDMGAFATGLRRIQNLCDEAECKVQFKTVQGGFVVCFYRKTEAASLTKSDRVHDEVHVEEYDDTFKDRGVISWY